MAEEEEGYVTNMGGEAAYIVRHDLCWQCGSVVPSAACAAGPFSLLPTITQPGSGCDWLNSNHRSDWLAINVRGQGKAPTENATYQNMLLLNLSTSHPSHTAVKTTHTHTQFQWFHACATMMCKTGQQLPVPGQGANLACWHTPPVCTLPGLSTDTTGYTHRLLLSPCPYYWSLVHRHQRIHTLTDCYSLLAFASEAWFTHTNTAPMHTNHTHGHFDKTGSWYGGTGRKHCSHTSQLRGNVKSVLRLT